MYRKLSLGKETDFDSNPRNRERSSLLRLPAELRNKIFILAIGGDAIYVPYTLAHRKFWPLQPGALNNPCRQLRSETAFMHFHLNTYIGRFDMFLTPKRLLQHPELHEIRQV
jgi:hypothetical protein